MSVLYLPTQEDDLHEALDVLVGAGIRERNLQQIDWWNCFYYLKGIRDFNIMDYNTAEVALDWEDEYGNLHLRWEELLQKRETHVGRLFQVDLSPHVERLNYGLGALRDASVAQVVLDSMMEGLDQDRFKLDLLNLLVDYGTAGIGHWEQKIPGVLFGFENELIPPWQLLPIPAFMESRPDQRGIIRHRKVSLEWLRRRAEQTPGLSIPKQDVSDLEIIERAFGTHSARFGADDSGDPGGSYRTLHDETGRKRSPQAAKRGKRLEKIVTLDEVFTFGPRGSVDRIVTRVGRIIAGDTAKQRQTDIRIPFPVGICRHTDVQGFYGRSWVSQHHPLAHQVEQFIEKLFQEGGDLDRFGMVFIPTNQGIQLDDLKDLGGGPRFSTYEPDYVCPDIKPFNIGPASIGDLPGRIGEFGLGLLDRSTGLGEMYQGDAPGRVDSGQGISALSRIGSTNLVPVAESLAAGMSTIYRSMLYQAFRKSKTSLTGQQDFIKVTHLSDALAGVTLDERNGVMGMALSTQNPVPSPWDVIPTVKSRDPVDREKERMEAWGMFQAQILPRLEFIILNYKNNWRFPVGNRAIWEAYRRAVLENLVMFADGRDENLEQRVNPIVPFGGRMSSDSTIASVQLLVLNDFMSSPEFLMADAGVRNAFAARKQHYEQARNPMLPEQAPSVEEAAEQQSRIVRVSSVGGVM